MSDEPHDVAERDEDFVRDAHWFAEHYDPERNEFTFAATSRNALAAQPFLDARWDRAQSERRHVDVSALLRQIPKALPSPNFIWHTGLCCSTLLAKAIDRTGSNLSLCEPQILVEVADAKRKGAPAGSTQFDRVPELAFRLLSKSFESAARVTLKPAPAANCLIGEAVRRTTGPILFLYSDCRSFLISIAKLGEEGRKYARRMFLAIAADGHPQSRWPPGQLLSLSDLEMAAVVWHMQIAQFLRSWPSPESERAFSLDCDAFLCSPEGVLTKLDEVFSLNLGEEHIRHLVVGPLFSKNAKSPVSPYDFNKRREEHSRVEQQLGSDLDRIVRESYRLCRSTPRGVPLPNPLLTIDKTYVR